MFTQQMTQQAKYVTQHVNIISMEVIINALLQQTELALHLIQVVIIMALVINALFVQVDRHIQLQQLLLKLQIYVAQHVDFTLILTPTIFVPLILTIAQATILRHITLVAQFINALHVHHYQHTQLQFQTHK